MKAIQIERSRITKILVIKTRAIGDVILSTPVLPNLRREFPSARIDFLVEKFAAPILAGNPFIDHVISFDAKSQSSLSLILTVRRNKYDLIIDLLVNPRTAIITMFSGARFKVGYPFKWRRYAYNILAPSRDGDYHNVDFNLDSLRRNEIPITTTQPLFYLDEESENFAREFLQKQNLSKNKFVSIQPSGGWEIKRWKTEKFAELCRMVREQLHLEAVVFYGPSERADAERISSSSNAVLAPQTSLHEMGAIMRQSLLLITNDNGPMHIAATLKVPTLVIYGPTNPRTQGPYGNISEIVRNEKLDCLECSLTKCPIGNLCMTELAAETVYQKLVKLISRIEEMKTQGFVSPQPERLRKDIDENV